MRASAASDVYHGVRHSLRTYVSECISRFVCSTCKQQMNSCKRIPICGHSVCENCLNLETRMCPVCERPFELTEVDHQETVNKFMKKILDLKNLLGDEGDTAAASPNSNVPDCNQGPSDIAKQKKKMPRDGEAKEKKDVGKLNVLYQDTQFSITFINDLGAKRNAKGETPLHNACKKRDMNTVTKLISQGADLNAKDFAGWVPLHEAIQVAAEDIVKILIQKGALINIPGPEYTTPLHMAIAKGYLGIIEYLVSNGANLDAIDYNGKKPLDINNKPKIAEVIENTIRVDSPVVYNIRIYATVTAYCHSIDNNYLKKLTENQNKLIKIKKVFSIEDSSLTHIIVKSSHDISCKILLAIAAGIYVVPQEYIDEWSKGNFRLPLDKKTPIISNEEVNQGIRRSMLNKFLGRPKLFDGIKFFISGHKNFIKIGRLNVNKTFLGVLIKAGGGEVLHRPPASRLVGNLHYPYHCATHVDLKQCTNIIIFEENKPPALQYNMPELKHRTSQWLIKAVMCHNLEGVLPPDDDITFV